MTSAPARDLKVAILLATHNGGRFIEPQIRSFADNTTAFTLHWLDDHSTDATPDVVRATATNMGLSLTEWRHPQRQGIPAAFFHLMECVEADLYLFSDQDDIWQAGKIDATVAALLPDLNAPVVCFSDPLMFKDDPPGRLRRASTVIRDARYPQALEESRVFMAFANCGNTQGFTRALRDIYLRHREIARAHALMHDWWLYLIGVACGGARLLADAPTTLYRRHGSNFTEFIVGAKGLRLARQWQVQQMLRPILAKQALGFALASNTLPPGPRLERLLELARLVSCIDARQSPAALMRLARARALWPTKRSALFFAAACLWGAAPSQTAQSDSDGRAPALTGSISLSPAPRAGAPPRA